MINYGIQRGTIRPQEIQITSGAVFIAKNITPYTKEFDGYTEKGYEYEYIGYTKDEYILQLAHDNQKLQQDLIDTQMALCDIYESIEGGEYNG